MNEVQQFSSAPQAVGTRKKYRDPDDRAMTHKGNMMQDRRVVRGNTYAALVAPQPDMAEVQKQREAQRRRLMRASQKERRAGTPEPVAGRKHMDIQTDSFLEELTERTVEFEAETQTDFLLDRPPSPLFMPAKIGVDAETRIEEGELFDFDAEVEPVLEVLVGKTLEQGMMEVLEEEELESLRRHQEDFEKKRGAELQEVQRIEAAEKRRSDEMARRMQQQAVQRENDLGKMRKVVSRGVACAHLSGLRDRALNHLLDAGVFADSVELGVETAFMPELLETVSKQMGNVARTRAALDAVVRQSFHEKLERHTARLDVERRRVGAIDQAEREARREKAELAELEKKEAARIEAEREALEAWEARVPTPPPPPEEFQVTSLDAEKQMVTLDRAPGSAKIPDGKLEELQGVLGGLAEAQKLVATLIGPDGQPVLRKKHAAEEGGEASGEAPAGGEAAEGEAAPQEIPEDQLPTLGDFKVVEGPAAPPEGEEAAPTGAEA